MAFVNQELKKRIKAGIDEYLANVKDIKLSYTFSVVHNTTLIMNIRSANVDLIEHIVNDFDTKDGVDLRVWQERIDAIRKYRQYDISKDYDFFFIKDKRINEVISKLYELINIENYDNSDTMTDYFNVGYYSHITIGKWDKPFIVKA